MKNKIIEAEDLTKIYKKSVKAVDDILSRLKKENCSVFLDPTAQAKPLHKDVDVI